MSNEYTTYKNLLLQMKTKILNGGILRSTEDLHISQEDLSDEADLAASVINQQVTFEIRAKEIAKLKAIEEALFRIEMGTYGECDECGEPIGHKRLLTQPWATLCITHAEELEREQRFLKAV